MSKVLIRFDDNWADEMDLEGFRILTKKKYEKDLKTLNNYKGEYDLYFGTNEENNYEDTEALLAAFKVSEISDSDAEVLERLFGKSFSFGRCWDNAVERAASDEDN